MKIYCLTLVVFLSGCAAALKSSDLAAYDDYQKRADRLHQHLIGELAFKNDDLDLAYQTLSPDPKSTQAADHLLEISILREDLLGAKQILDQRLLASNLRSLDLFFLIQVNNLLEITDQFPQLQAIREEKFANDQLLFLQQAFLDLQKLEDPAEVITYIKQLPRKGQGFLLPILALGYELSGDLKAAQQTYQQCFSADIDCRSLENEYLEFLVRHGLIDDLRKYLESHKQRNLKHSYLNNILTKNSTKTNAEMTTWLQTITTHQVADLSLAIQEFNFKLICTLIDRKSLSTAVIAFNLFSLHYPDYVPAHFYLGTLYSTQKKYQSAISAFLKIQSTEEEYLSARLNIITILQEQQNLAEAEEILDELLADDRFQKNLSLWKIKIAVLNDQQEFQALKLLLEDLLILFPQDQDLLFQKAVTLQELNEIPQCLDILAQILKSHPNNSAALNFVAYTYAESGQNLDLAHPYIDRALIEEPQNPYYLDTKAWVYFQEGKYQEAEQYLEEALKFLPDDPVILEHFADLQAKMNKEDLAKSNYQKALNLARTLPKNNEIKKLIKRLTKRGYK